MTTRTLRSWGCTAAVAALVFAAAWRTGPARSQEPGKAAEAKGRDRTLDELREARLKVAREALDNLNRRVRAGLLSAGDGSIVDWWNRIAETHRDMEGGDPEEVLADLRSYIDASRRAQAVFEERLASGQIQNRDTVFKARYRVLEAESWLAEAQQKPSQ